MHPEIRKFWEQKSYILDYWDLSATNYNSIEDAQGYWVSYKSAQTAQIMGCILGNGTNLYWLDGKKYSENEMLRVIKMAAFL